MTVFPAAAHITNPARTEAEVKTDLDNWLAATKEMLGGASANSLTIAAGIVTPTSAVVIIDTEAAAATDDLTNIAVTNMPDGRFLLIRAQATGRTVVVKHAAGGTGQIFLADSVDLSLLDAEMYLLLRGSGGLQWKEAFRSYGPRKDLARIFYGLSNVSAQKTAAYTVVAADQGKTIEATANTWTLTLTAAATLGEGFSINFRNSGSGVVTVDPNASETIDGAATLAFPQGTSARLIVSNGNWITVGKAIAVPASVTNGGMALWNGTSGMILQNGAVPSSTVAATQAEMEAASSTSVMVTPGRQGFHPGSVKAWALFQGANGALSAQFNTSSVTRNGQGDYTWNIGTNFSGNDFSVWGLPLDNTRPKIVQVLTGGNSGAVNINTMNGNGNLLDCTGVYVGAVGDQ